MIAKVVDDWSFGWCWRKLILLTVVVFVCTCACAKSNTLATSFLLRAAGIQIDLNRCALLLLKLLK